MDGEEQIAIPEARGRITKRVVRLLLGLHCLGLAKASLRLAPAARLVQGVGMCRAMSHLQKPNVAAVGVDHGLPQRPGYIAQRQLQFAEVAGRTPSRVATGLVASAAARRWRCVKASWRYMTSSKD
jgi:hypothetical protein